MWHDDNRFVIHLKDGDPRFDLVLRDFIRLKQILDDYQETLD